MINPPRRSRRLLVDPKGSAVLQIQKQIFLRFSYQLREHTLRNPLSVLIADSVEKISQGTVVDQEVGEWIAAGYGFC